MGTMLQARCKCGYSSKEIFQGSGMIETQKDMEPAYCKQCSHLIVLNYLDPTPLCPHCHSEVKFYNDHSLQKTLATNNADDNSIQWSDFSLPDLEYLCPRCGKMTMKFYVVGNWD